MKQEEIQKYDDNKYAFIAGSNQTDENPKINERKLIKVAQDAYCKVCGHYHHTVPNHICRQDCDYYKRFNSILENEIINNIN